MNISDNTALSQGLRELQQRLPAGWTASLAKRLRTDTRPGEALIRIEAPDGRSGSLLAKVKRRLEPRGVMDLLGSGGGSQRAAAGFLVVSPYLSPAARERLREGGISYLDLTGNSRIELMEPGLLVQTEGARVDPDRRERPSRTLRGPKAGRVVRCLIDSRVPPGVRELAAYAGVDAGYASRIVALLDRETLVKRTGHGRITEVDWRRLLRRWAEEAPLESRGSQIPGLEPRGLQALSGKLKRFSGRYAITGTQAVETFAPVAPARLGIVYLEDAVAAMQALELRPVEAGANVLLVDPIDEGVFVGAAVRDSLRYVAISQAAADLLTSPGRGPAEAEPLIEWMAAHEEAWRG